MWQRVCLAALFGAGLFLVAGCSKVTRDNYDMIMVGKSTQLEVEYTLGKTYTARGQDQWEYDEEDRHLVVNIYFDAAGKVSKKEWIDAKTGEWHSDPADPQRGEKFSDETDTTTIKRD